MSIQIMESVKRLSRQLAEAEARIKALEFTTSAITLDITTNLRHDPTEARVQALEFTVANMQAEIASKAAPRGKRQADD